ncbi:MAG: DUF167 domain-containing protein [Gemmatimonadales bacterium]
MPSLRVVPGGLRLSIRVQPRARQTELAGTHGEALKIRVAAPPAEGAANAELLRFLAKRLELPRSAIRLVAGAASRNKIVEVVGVTEAAVRAHLELP